MSINLGRTNIRIPPIGFGTGFNFREKIKIKALAECLSFSINCGLKFIDTAENYGNGVVEETIGKVIRNKRSSVIIATKFSPENSSLKKVISACENSLKRLRTDYIDIYQFHWPNPSVSVEETFEALLRLKKAGKIRFIGVSNFSKSELVKSFIYLKDNLISLQTEYNLLERTIEENGIYKYCESKDLALIAYSPLDQGRLSGMTKTQVLLLDSLSNKYERTAAQIILAWIIRNGLTIAIPRSLSKTHIKENIEADQVKIATGDLKKINDVFAARIRLVPVAKISVSTKGEKGNPVYKTLEEAINNKLGFTPSPVELSEQIKKGEYLKPVRLVKRKHRNKKAEYDLIGGRIRYWAWLIAFGKGRPIPAITRENIQK